MLFKLLHQDLILLEVVWLQLIHDPDHELFVNWIAPHIPRMSFEKVVVVGYIKLELLDEIFEEKI